MNIIKIQDNYEKWLPDIQVLLRETIESNFESSIIPESTINDTMDKLIHYIDNGSAIVFLALQENHVTGLAWCHEIHRMSLKRLHIAYFAVMEQDQRKGIGSLLMKEIEKYAELYGYSGIDLMVTENNNQAIRFYEKFNFSTERLLMKKDIEYGN